MELWTTPLSRRSLTARPGIPGRSTRGFTLVELLVVIGIIVLLVSILLPMVNTARNHAKRASISSDLIGIAQALDQYKHDWGDYPQVTNGIPNTAQGSAAANPSTGAVALCWALIAPGPVAQDGADGGGWRVRGAQGKVYGPYLNVDHYRYGIPQALPNPPNPPSPGSIAVNLTPPATATDDSNTVLADSEGNIILYFPGHKAVSPSAQGLVDAQPIGTTPPTSVYNYNDNGPFLPGPSPDPTKTPGTLSPKMMAYKLGNISAQNSGPWKTMPGETPLVAPYLLWSAGPAETLGPKATGGSGNLVTTGDDDEVTYPELPPVGAGITP